MNYIYYRENGQIIQLSSGPDACKPAEIFEACSMPFNDIISDDGAYVQDGRVIPKPPKPDQYHQFDYTAKQWYDPRTEADFINKARADRMPMLQSTDWTQLADVPAETREMFAAYRQALRDITKQPDPRTIVWPKRPN